MKNFLALILRHKIIVSIIVLSLVGGNYFIYQKTNTSESVVKYTTATVEYGMLINSLSGTGQVLASNQVEINPKVSGDIVLLNIKNGQEVKKNDLITQIDARDAVGEVNEAKNALENAKFDLEELLESVDSYILLQAENNLADSRDTLSKLIVNQKNEYQDFLKDKDDAEDDLVESYEDAYSTISNVFLDLPDVVTGLYDTLFGDTLSEAEIVFGNSTNDQALLSSFDSNDYEQRDEFEEFVDRAIDYYNDTKEYYDLTFDHYKNTNRYSNETTIEELLATTIETIKKTSDTIKSEVNMFDYWIAYRTEKNYEIYGQIDNYQSALNSYTSLTNSHLSSLLSAQRSIKNYKEAIEDAEKNITDAEVDNPLDLAQAERNVKEKEENLADLIEGATELEIKNEKITIQQKENLLVTAQQNLANCYIRAPFDGIMAEVNISLGDTVSSGTNIGSIITNQKIAEITLNEIDAAQVAIGQKANLTFDAISDLSITGEVAEIDTLGTVNSGVVSYDIKIAFDVQDERIKSDMSVSVDIITESKANVLLTPINAVKTVGTNNYVEILIDGQVQKKNVTIGLSSDIMIEIVEGLEKNEEIITQTTNGSTSSQTQSSSKNKNSSKMGGMMMLR